MTTAEDTRRARVGETADRVLRAARLWITLHRPYYSRALFACPLIATDQVETMAIDTRWRIYINPGHVASRSIEETAADLIHELNHGLRSHASRARRLGVEHAAARLWNIAADFEINDDLIDDDLQLADGLLPGDFGLDEWRTAEHYYREILDNAETVEAVAASAVLRCGSGCTGLPADSETAPEHDPRSGPGLDPVEQDMLRHVVASALQEHVRSRGTGHAPQGLRRWADNLLHPRIDWRRTLASAVRRGLHHRTGAADYTWQRPPRRGDPNDTIIRPGMARPVPDLTVIVDTSASMQDHDLDQALAEIQAILTRVVPGDSIRVYSVDTQIANQTRAASTRHINLKGGGGTDMRTGIEAAAETAPAAIIVITDGWTPWPPTPPHGRPLTIAALTDNTRARHVPDWIRAIDIADR